MLNLMFEGLCCFLQPYFSLLLCCSLQGCILARDLQKLSIGSWSPKLSSGFSAVYTQAEEWNCAAPHLIASSTFFPLFTFPARPVSNPTMRLAALQRFFARDFSVSHCSLEQTSLVPKICNKCLPWFIWELYRIPWLQPEEEFPLNGR